MSEAGLTSRSLTGRGLAKGSLASGSTGPANGAARIDSIDYFRGLSAIFMVLVDYLGGIASVPGWLRHAPDVGLTVADLVAPAFIFAIGLSYVISFRRRAERQGLRATYYHFVARFLAIAGIGAIFTAGATIVAPGEYRGAWSALQAIGMAGLIALALIRTSTLARLLAGLGLLVAYQLVLDRFWLGQVLASSHGGLAASLSWGAMLLIATALADLFHRDERGRSDREGASRGRSERGMALYAGASTALLAAGLLASLVFPVSKNRVSLSYVLISVAISALVFLAFDVFSRKVALRLPLLHWWGRNPLLLYVIHILLEVVQLLPGSQSWYAGAPLWSAFGQFAAEFAVMSLIAWRLDRAGAYVRL